MYNVPSNIPAFLLLGQLWASRGGETLKFSGDCMQTGGGGAQIKMKTRLHIPDVPGLQRPQCARSTGRQIWGRTPSLM